MKMDLSGKILLTIISISVVAVIASTAYKFLWLKDYNFIVEAECRPGIETCFTRDCSNADDCPPNDLENYKVFEVSARDFEQCSDNSCAVECSNGSIQCTEIVCGETEGDECSMFEESVPVPVNDSSVDAPQASDSSSPESGIEAQ